MSLDVSWFKWIVVLLVLIFASCLDCQLTYDFIIVGSGAGGSCLARRLVENGKFKVLLLEAGGHPPKNYRIPVRATDVISNPAVTFLFQSVTQKNAALITNGTGYAVSGRMLGGSTSFNYMWFNRGHPRDWDNWAHVTGDPSWKYENMLKYFKRVENYQGDYPSADQHGFGGPITITRPRYAPGLDYWLAAGRELNYSVADPNGPQKKSFTPVEFSKRFGRRVSSAVGYLEPICKSPNLKVLINTTVTQVIFEGNRAVGVKFASTTTKASGLKKNVAFASKEVILCAGAYNSPLILQRSGIGPKKILEAANIPLVKELPVGQNYQDHPGVSLNFVLNNPSLVLDEERDLNSKTWTSYNLYGDGPYSNTRGATGQALLSSSVANSEGNGDWPDLHVCMAHSTKPHVHNDLYLTSLKNVKPGEAPFFSTVFLGRPYSRGSVAINPEDPVWGNPVLDFGWLTDSRDMQLMLDGIKEAFRIYEDTNSYRKLQVRYSPVDLPACEQFSAKSEEYWNCYVRQVISGGCHPAGTTKMGKTDDPSAVVDNELRVIGTEGLRVVDASIMPFIVNTNPQAPVYAIAEKVADIIKAKWKQSSKY